MTDQEEINVLKLTLHDRLIGYLAGYQNGRNVLSFADDFRVRIPLKSATHST